MRAVDAMHAIRARNRTPILAGGTMLYFNALERGLAPLPEADAQVRAELEQEASHIGWPAMHEQLQAIDPAAAKRIHQNDPQRIQRALEVYRLTGRSLTQCQADTQSALPEPVFSSHAGGGVHRRSKRIERTGRHSCRPAEYAQCWLPASVVVLEKRG